uniref:Uncharacterized protein n=1 Tax=Brassica oleracea TaxID=3712 RepID=A0A3P6CRX8_BRAOL|nr:unnamed protein product [Brassica oleracea]
MSTSYLQWFIMRNARGRSSEEVCLRGWFCLVTTSICSTFSTGCILPLAISPTRSFMAGGSQMLPLFKKAFIRRGFFKETCLVPSLLSTLVVEKKSSVMDIALRTWLKLL